MVSQQLKQDIDEAVAFVEQNDPMLPGAAKANQVLTALQAAAETPLVLNILAAILTSKGF